MNRAELTHQRVFSDKEMADRYFKRNSKNIERVAQRFVGLLKKTGFSKGNVLDSGCGFGTMSIVLAKSFPNINIKAVDLSGPLLEMARQKAREEGVGDRVDFLKADVAKLPFEDNSFDLSLNSFMLHIVDRPVDMLNEIERVTRDGGRIMMTDLRRFWMGLFMNKVKSSFVLEEALGVIKKSNLREGKGSNGLFWWDYMAGL